MANKSLQSITVFSVIALFLLLNCVCADEGVINGYVKDNRSNPLEGIIIEIYETGDKINPVAQTKTDSKGFYSVNLTNGTYEVCVIGGSDSWIYQKTKIDYFRDFYWIPRLLKVTDETPVVNVGLTTISIIPWDWIAALVFIILCLIIFDQVILLRRNINLIGLADTLLVRLKHGIDSIIRSSMGTYSGMPPKKDKVVGGGVENIGVKIEAKEVDIRLKTLQTFCPIVKMKLTEIPKDKLYMCPGCKTYYHYDSIAPMKACINCGTPVSPVFPMNT